MWAFIETVIGGCEYFMDFNFCRHFQVWARMWAKMWVWVFYYYPLFFNNIIVFFLPYQKWSEPDTTYIWLDVQKKKRNHLPAKLLYFSLHGAKYSLLNGILNIWYQPHLCIPTAGYAIVLGNYFWYFCQINDFFSFL